MEDRKTETFTKTINSYLFVVFQFFGFHCNMEWLLHTIYLVNTFCPCRVEEKQLFFRQNNFCKISNSLIHQQQEGAPPRGLWH